MPLYTELVNNHNNIFLCRCSAHKLLVQRFFRNASHLRRPLGDIHVSHKMGQPYDKWGIEELASEFALAMFQIVPCRKEDYTGDNQKRGDGDRCDEEFPLCNGCTFKFRVRSLDEEEIASLLASVAVQCRVDLSLRRVEMLN